MTVSQLKKELEKYPDNMDVFLDERLTEFKFGLLNSVKKKKINFKEEPDGEVLATDNCVILSEE